MENSNTRQKLLEHLFADMRKNGFQGLRADKVVAELDITKGALYHYFPNKQAIGLAVLQEIVGPSYLGFYRSLENASGNPIDLLHTHLHDLANCATDEDVALGCPLNNLVQEMSPLDEQFRLRMKAIVDAIQHSIARALKRGQEAGWVRNDLDPMPSALFFFASLEGAYSMAKVQKSAAAFRSNVQFIHQFVEQWRA